MLAILERVERGDWTLLSSAVLEFELTQNPDAQRRTRTLRFLSLAREQIGCEPRVSARADELRKSRGLRALDALHLASAEALRADVFLTTDDRLVRAAQRITIPVLHVRVANPLPWLTGVLSAE